MKKQLSIKANIQAVQFVKEQLEGRLTTESIKATEALQRVIDLPNSGKVLNDSSGLVLTFSPELTFALIDQLNKVVEV